MTNVDIRMSKEIRMTKEAQMTEPECPNEFRLQMVGQVGVAEGGVDLPPVLSPAVHHAAGR
jgi:hypothetical protein